MFSHMQTLPIRYFDTHTHGDIMSHYTNDTDTLRQFISQALPQFISAVVTIVVILGSMLASSVPLTILVLAVTVIMALVTRKIGGASAKYFMKQQWNDITPHFVVYLLLCKITRRKNELLLSIWNCR